MENTIKNILKKYSIPFEKEVSSDKFPAIKKALGTDKKRFDFVIKKPSITYLIETNFYNGGGSKLNETARSYTDISPKINNCNGFKFIWVTDGQGWLYAKNKLEEAYNSIPNLYNLTSFIKFVDQLKK